MKSSIIFRLFGAAFAFLCLMTISAVAQSSGVGVHGYASIDYDEETNTVMAYSETDIDYDLSGNYETYVQLTVTKSDGTVAASGTARDDYNFGFVELVLEFTGEAGETYTATGRHCAFITLWDYYDYYPYDLFYYDHFYVSYFEAQGIYEPWFHFFESPGYRQYTIQTDFIRLGRTYDSTSIVASSDIKFNTISNDVNNYVAVFSEEDGITTQTATVNLSGASRTVCGPDRTSFNITVNFDLPPNAVSIFHPDARTYITDSSNQQFQFLGFNFDGTTYFNGKGKMNIVVRQVRPTETDNSFRIHIQGGLQPSGTYNGNARVRFICP